MSDEATLHIGFTGTREGLTSAQHEALGGLLAAFTVFEGQLWFHHGDCIGGDKESHELAVRLGYKTWGHPPDNPLHRAFCAFDRVEAALPYLERNKVIVHSTQGMIACPLTDKRTGGGTWSTWGLALKCLRPTYLILPSGRVHFSSPELEGDDLDA
jgi:hypothetical protein